MSDIIKDSPEYFNLRKLKMDALKHDIRVLMDKAGISNEKHEGGEHGFPPTYHFILDGDPYYTETVDEFAYGIGLSEIVRD